MPTTTTTTAAAVTNARENQLHDDATEKRHGCFRRNVHIPVYDVSQEIVVPQSVIDVHLLIVDRQGAGANTPLVFLGWMGTEFPRKDFQDLLADPSTFRECREGKVIGIYLTET